LFSYVLIITVPHLVVKLFLKTFRGAVGGQFHRLSHSVRVRVSTPAPLLCHSVCAPTLTS